MKKTLKFIIWFVVIIFLTAHPIIPSFAATTFVTIGTGGVTGTYYPTGGAIAKIINKKRRVYGIRCTVESTSGSVFNVNGIRGGDLEFGIVQSDRQYQAWRGLAEWKEMGPQRDLRAVFSIHSEAVTIVAAIDAGILKIDDLRHKRVNIGSPGSGQRQNAIDALQNAGINYQREIRSEWYPSRLMPRLLQDGRIDAFFYTAGHPNGLIKEATSGWRKVRFISITNIKNLLRRYPYYAKTKIPIRFYPGVKNVADVDTFGVKATLVTSAKVPDFIVYAITKEVFENLDSFKKLHPAYGSLTKKSMLKGLSAPFHRGALRYFKEAGLIK
jgi:TRAP transporter TAXI family solute receptor